MSRVWQARPHTYIHTAHLPAVGGRAFHHLFAGGTPLVNALVLADVPNAVGVDLEQAIVLEKDHLEGGRRGEEPGVRDLLHRVADAEHE